MSNLKKIAIEAGLAEGTVSRILKGSDQCAEKTRERVLAIARKHKYRPNMLVRGMQTGRTNTVGVMLPMSSEFFGRILLGVHNSLVAQDHVPIVLWSYDELAHVDVKTIPSELKQIYRLLDRRVDGIILRPIDDAVSDDYLKEILDRNIPLVAVDRELEHAHVDFVGTDDEAIGRLAAAHLLALGHRRLGHIAGPESVTTSRRRRRGFEKAVADAGATCQTVVDPFFGEGTDIIRELLASPKPPSAIFTANDILAAEVFKVAAEIGLRIPQDLSVVGCGNLSVATLLTPALTTFAQPTEKIGEEAVRLLFKRLEKPRGTDAKKPKPRRVILNSPLVLRNSTAPASKTKSHIT